MTKLIWGVVINLVLAVATLVIAVFSVVQALAAKRSADTAERAMRLTERADVLLEVAGIEVAPGHTALDGDSRVVLTFKNYGRTRANNVEFIFHLTTPDMAVDSGPPETVPTVLGAGDTQTTPFSRFREFLNQPTFNGVASGKIPLTLDGFATYTDVFNVPHRLECRAIFDPRNCSFRVEKNDAG